MQAVQSAQLQALGQALDVSFSYADNPTYSSAEFPSINATILGAATDDQLTTSIDGITLRYWMREQGLDAMLKLQNRFQQIVQNEIRRQAGHGGLYAVQHHAIEDTRLAGPWFSYPPPRLRA